MSFEQFEREVKRPTQRTQRHRSDAYAVQHYHDKQEHPAWHWLRIIVCMAGAFAIGWMASRGGA